MRDAGTVTMSAKELDRLEVVGRVIETATEVSTG